jgi:hypothetical protein
VSTELLNAVYDWLHFHLQGVRETITGPTISEYVKFGIIAAVIMRNTLFWNVTQPCRLVHIYRVSHEEHTLLERDAIV